MPGVVAGRGGGSSIHGAVCRVNSVAKVKALPALQGLVGGQFVHLLANTLKEGTWIARKPRVAA